VDVNVAMGVNIGTLFERRKKYFYQKFPYVGSEKLPDLIAHNLYEKSKKK
jgi:hypothetical protein